MTDTQEWILMPKELSTEMILGAHHYVSPETWAAFLSARPSPDHQFHWCRAIYYDEMGIAPNEGRGPVIRPKDQPICFWAPEAGG